jgi:diguanylate cyclase (GGDEF)-like protein
MLDIDHFKQINDTHGHAAGDRVLHAVATRLEANLRESDLCGRLGGEEFAVLLAGTDLQEALAIAEKLRLAIQAIVLPINDITLSVTISIGGAEAGVACPDATTLLTEADAAMYHAKSNGRNRVHGGRT